MVDGTTGGSGSAASDKASNAQKVFEQAMEAAEKAIKANAGLVRVVVDGAKMICSMTMPPKTMQTLKVPGTRSLVEGKPLANVSDVVKNSNIAPWSCKCQLLPSGNDFLPCAYAPASLWTPPAIAESSVPSNPKLTQDLGKALAKASKAISAGNPLSKKECYRRVADAVDQTVGSFLSGGHAYMAAGQLAAHPAFMEVSATSLGSLPEGAIVVWGKGTSESGHISIALGDGRESSDFVGKQMTSHYGGARARVFVPKVANELAVPETAVLRCSVGGVISIVDPNQSTKRVKF